ncbi:Uncharacterised protein r2_g625 [Pycnogonum litorale]
MDHIRLGSEAVRFVRLYNPLVFLLLLLISSKVSFAENMGTCKLVELSDAEVIEHMGMRYDDPITITTIVDSTIYGCRGNCSQTTKSCTSAKEKWEQVSYYTGGIYPMHVLVSSHTSCKCG